MALAPLSVQHVNVNCSDLARSLRFYRDVVGLEPMTEADDEWAWFWTGKPRESSRLAVHRGTLLFEEHSPHPEGRRFGQVHFALQVRPDRLEPALQQVREHGLEVYGPQHFEWMNATGYYFYDPDGNLVEYWVEE